MFLSLFLILMGPIGSSYSSPDILKDSLGRTLNPINFNIVWEPYEFYDLPPGSPDQKAPDPMWGEHYKPKLAAAHSIDANWVHARLAGNKSMQSWAERSEHPWFWWTGFAIYDSALKWIQNDTMTLFALSSPNTYYTDSIYDSLNSTYRDFCNDSGYWWYWHVLVERYNNDGIAPDTTPWGEFITENNSIYSIEYWEICNEPANGIFQSWGGYYEKISPYPYASNSVILAGDSFSIYKFVNYIKVSADAIHAAGGKVIGPATVTPLITCWDTAIVWDTLNDLKTALHDTNYFSNRYEFWKILDSSGALDCFDIISVHGYVNGSNHINISSFFSQLDSLRNYLYLDLQIDKPIWVTEIGWQRHWFGDTYIYPSGDNFIPNHNPSGRERADSILSKLYIDYCEASLSREWLGKTFLWDICSFNSPDSISDWWYAAMYRPYDNINNQLFDPIPFNSFYILRDIYDIIIPKVRLTYPDAINDTFTPEDICIITYDNISDNYSSYSTATPLDSIFIMIEFSINNGLTWDIIVDSLIVETRQLMEIENDMILTGSGQYQWIIPNITSNQCKVRVIATDQYGFRGISESSGLFSIQTYEE